MESIQSLVPVFTGTIRDDESQVVDGRALHRFLRVDTHFKDWIARRIAEYDFQDGEDFRSFLSKSGGGRPSTEYHLTLDMAKELSMVERNEQGRQARQYFIQCEKKLRQIAPQEANSILSSTIGTDGFHCLAAVLDGKLRHLPTKARQRAKMHVWAQVHKAFSVISAEDIPAAQLDSARNFIAAYNVHEGEWLPKQTEVQASANTLNELDLAMLYVFCIDTLELVYVGEKLKPVFETLRAPLTMNVRKCLGECREAVAHLHERFGSQMEQAARRRKVFDGRLNLTAAGDLSQPIWVSRRA